MENPRVDELENERLRRFVDKFGPVVVGCAAGKSVEQMTIADFVETDMGKLYVGSMATGYETLTESGMNDEQALTIVGGAAIIRDESDEIMGLKEQRTTPQNLGSKKKLSSKLH